VARRQCPSHGAGAAPGPGPTGQAHSAADSNRENIRPCQCDSANLNPGAGAAQHTAAPNPAIQRRPATESAASGTALTRTRRTQARAAAKPSQRRYFKFCGSLSRCHGPLGPAQPEWPGAASERRAHHPALLFHDAQPALSHWHTHTPCHKLESGSLKGARNLAGCFSSPGSIRVGP
jgi:hypothetical protein